MDSKTRLNFIYLAIAMIGTLLLMNVWMESRRIAQIPYSEFSKALRENRVSDVVVSENHIKGNLTSEQGSPGVPFVTTRVDTQLADVLDTADVKYSQSVESTLLRDNLSWIFMTLLFTGLIVMFVRRMAGQNGVGGRLMSIGRSNARVYMETDTKTTFQDVAGVDEAKEELEEVVNFLKDAKRYSRLGGRMPKGVLLVGPPGTGKTLLARAVAGEASVPFFSISGSEFVEMFVGVGAARVRDLFEQARQKAPCIVFVDELDALGRARGSAGMGGGHDEKEQTLNQLLVELDGFDSSTGLIMLAATNRPEILDPALLRAGRFDRQVLVDRPDKKGRIEVLKVHLKKIVLAEDVDSEKVAALTPGFTGADLANLVNEAALIATRRDAPHVTMEDFSAGIERIIAGLEKKNRILNEKERRIVAFHEMGHALVATTLPGADPVHKVSIIPRGIGALGYTLQRPTEDRFLMTRGELENRMSILLGGRAAEKIMFDHLSTGAADDLSKATDIARNMVTRYGMDENLGSVTYDSEPVSYLGAVTPGLHARRFSEDTAKDIDRAIKDLVMTAFRQAIEILERNKEVLVESAEALLSRETLSQDDLVLYAAKIRT